MKVRTEFKVNISLLDRLRLWWHGKRYRITETMSVGDGAILIECSCGGHAQIQIEDHVNGAVEFATCWQWQFVQHLQRKRLPCAKVRP
jgi:hypothetical protein